MCVKNRRRILKEEKVVNGLRCYKSEQCEDGEKIFEFGQDVNMTVCCAASRVLRMEEKLGDEERERQHTFQSLGNEGNEMTG